MKPPGFTLPSPAAFAAALAVVGVLPAIQAPLPGLSLDTKLGTGLYLATMITLGVLGVIADRQATTDARKREADRDTSAAERHDAFVAIVKEQRDEDRSRSAEDRQQLEAMFAKFERGLAADARREELVAAGRPVTHPSISALSRDASGAWHDVVQMYAARQRYQGGTVTQLAAAAQMQRSIGADEIVPAKPKDG